MRRTTQTLTLALIGLLALMGLAGPAAAQLRIDITSGTVKPMPIAIPDFSATDPRAGQVGRDIAGVITGNLKSSGLFNPLSPASFLQQLPTIDTPPNFGDWRAINAEALVQGMVGIDPDGQLRVSFRLWDVFGGNQITGKSFRAEPANWRRMAHIVSDAIYEALTGESGYFDTRVVFISESGARDNRKRLAIMDQDGENLRYLTNGSNIVLTPRFSPTAQEITYLAFTDNGPRVYLYNIDTGRQELLGNFPGMTFAPRFSPDGNKVAMSLAQGGNTEIYEMDVRTRRSRRLTSNPAIDTSPSYSPDGSEIVFNSDRGGSQQLYVMGADGGNARRISFGDGRYATPVWSPRGDLIAFTKIERGGFSVGVMKPDGSGERILARGFLVEAPTWAPNGRVLMFFRQGPSGGGRAGVSRLYAVDLTGRNERQINTPEGASDPAWSPILPK